jgi:hypothetical protein
MGVIAREGGDLFEAHGELEATGNRQRTGAVAIRWSGVVSARSEIPRAAAADWTGCAWTGGTLEIRERNGEVNAGWEAGELLGDELPGLP